MDVFRAPAPSRLTVASLARLDQLLGQKKQIFQIEGPISKVDSGMGRIGFRRIERDQREAERLLFPAAGAEIEGIFTHFATADGSR